MGAKKIEWSRWYLIKDGTRLRIRRCKYEQGKTIWERYPFKDYAAMRPTEVEALVRRLNASYEVERREAEERYNFNHTYVNEMALKKFERYLERNITEPSVLKTTMTRLHTHVLEFFILQCKLPDPAQWHRKEDEWREWLLEKNVSSSVLRKTVQIANKFTKYLSTRLYPEMTRPHVLEPFGRRLLEKVAHERRGRPRTKFIKPATWEEILKYAMEYYPVVVPNMRLCMAFGLRISETMGLTKDKFLRDCLIIDEQWASLKNGKILRKKVKTFSRRVPYWNMTAREAWEVAQMIKPMHKNTLVNAVNECLTKFGHRSHDFRRTFITNSFRSAPHWKDVMKAAGHQDVRTTLGYDQDDRDLSEEKADLD